MNHDPDWEILEGSFYEDERDTLPEALHRESYEAPQSLFALSNGYLGIRGAQEEGSATVAGRASYINGYYERSPIVYGENAFGYARWHETIVSVPDGSGSVITVDGTDPCEPDRLVSAGRRLDLGRGILERQARYRVGQGGELSLRTERFVSLQDSHLGVMRTRVRVSGGGRLVFSAVLDATSANAGAQDDPRVGAKFGDQPFVIQASREDTGLRLTGIRTRTSGLYLACALSAEAQVFRSGRQEALAPETGGNGDQDGQKQSIPFSVDLAEADELVVTRYLVYVRDPEAGAGTQDDAARGLAGAEALLDQAAAEAEAARLAGFDALLQEHSIVLSRFWAATGFKLKGPAGLAAAIRFNLLHVFQAAGRDGLTNAPAKGLTGEGYEGHYFWDTEIYFLPLFSYTAPEIARALLSYRAAILDSGRKRAREMGHRQGVLFPWRTISGVETSAYYPAGTAQYHINADIAWGVERYALATGDRDFLYSSGAEILVETARLWLDAGHYGRDGRFRLDGVTGPDEYSAVVNNNTYTNVMARANLRAAISLVARLRRDEPELYGDLVRRLELKDGETAEWERAASSMYLPYDEQTGIIPQDDSFMEREPWDLAGTPRSKFPLLLHYHPLTIYRKQVLKQPDLLLAMLLRARDFSLSDKKRCFDFYEPLTTGDSSLSHCVMSIMAAETGQTEKAWEYFSRTVRLDLDDLHGNSIHGVHVAAMGGSWLSLVYGFAGFRDDDGLYRFAPRLPAQLDRLAFSLGFGGGRLSLSLDHEFSEYRWEGKPAFSFLHEGAPVQLSPGASVRFENRSVLKAVIFDLDGVLADTAILHYRAWKRLADELGLAFDLEANEALKGVSRMESLDLLLGSAAGRYSAAEKAVMADRKNGYYQELVAGLTPDDALPGARELVKELRNRNILVGLASASRNAKEVLNRLGWAEDFDAVADAALARPKPDPEIFLSAAQALGVRRFDCVGVEDAQAGIQAIRGADMKAVAIGQGLTGADLKVDAISRLSVENLLRLF